MERMTALGKAILLSDTQIPCVPFPRHHLQSPGSLCCGDKHDAWNTDSCLWTSTVAHWAFSQDAVPWVVLLPWESLGGWLYRPPHPMLDPEWHIRTVGLSSLGHSEEQGIFQPGHGVPPSFVPRRPGLTTKTAMPLALPPPRPCILQKALIPIPRA